MVVGILRNRYTTYSHLARIGCLFAGSAPPVCASRNASAGVGSFRVPLVTAVSIAMTSASRVSLSTSTPDVSPAPRRITCTFLRIMSVTKSWCGLGNTGNPRLFATNASSRRHTARTGSPTHRCISLAEGSAAPTSRHTPSEGCPSHSARKVAHCSNGSRWR